MRRVVTVLALVVTLGALTSTPARERWSEQQANQWYAREPWILGANYIPATAINQLEMWQADTFDPARVDLELGWAEAIGMNCMRVFLHDLLWQQDAEGFRQRIDAFLGIAARHHIRVLFVLFDSVWDPRAQLGRQHAPVPGVHNSGWVQSPSAAALTDPGQYPRLEAYVKGIIGAFAGDRRILGWDVWNEPAYSDKVGGSYASFEAHHKGQLVRALLPKVFAWARAAGATQPLTSGLWGEDWEVSTHLSGTPLIHFLPQLRQAGHLRAQGDRSRSIPAAAHLHRVHGTHRREHLRGHAADREALPRRCDQLGSGAGQDADDLSLGLVAETVRS